MTTSGRRSRDAVTREERYSPAARDRRNVWWTARIPPLVELLQLFTRLTAPCGSLRDRPESLDEWRTDEQLVRGICAGDRSAWASLYARYAVILHRIALRLLRRHDEAEDLLQDLFYEAWRRADSYDPQRATVKTWLLIRLRTRALDRIRAARVRYRLVHRDQQVAMPVPDQTNNPAERYLAMIVRRVVGGLPKDQRRLLELADFQSLSLPEVAAALRIPVGTVKSRRHHLVQKLGELPLPTGEVSR